MDKRLVTVILMAVAVALVITVIFYQITVGRQPVQADVPTRELVVAQADLPMGSVITTENMACTPRLRQRQSETVAVR